MSDQAARFFLCACCRKQVLVCSHCDRGQHYCANGCASRTRRLLQRDAGRRYQHSRAGRFKHALRLRRWRERRAAQIQEVTHQGSQTAFEADLKASSTLEIDLSCEDFDPTELITPVPATSMTAPLCATGSRHISIRVPARLLAAYKARATGTKYQTLIIRTLKSEMASWDIAESPL